MSSAQRSRPPATTIDDWIAQVRAQVREVDALVEPLAASDWGVRPSPTKWSVAEHVAHLALATRPYVAAIDAAVTSARERGQLGEAPYRTTFVGRCFVRSLEPPPRLAIRTLRVLEPPPELERASTITDFVASQEGLIAALEHARAVDLGCAHMRSPYFRWLRLTVADAVQVVLAHNRRHMWHMRRILGR